MDKTILVVDDNPMNHKILFGILQNAGYKVLKAMNGKEALDMIETGVSDINIILLDLFMPVMDGYELLQKMNENGMIQNIPVIVLTVSDEQETEIRCLQAGAADFLKKPYNAEIVQHKVDSILRLWDNAKLIQKIEKDYLTGRYNKEIFFKKAQERLVHNPEKPYMILYFNIEDFKLINANYGISSGDKLLKYIGKQILHKWGTEGICGRIRADIFGVLLPVETLPTQEEAGRIYAESMKESPVKGTAIKCGIYRIIDKSIGIAAMCDYAKIAEESIKHQYGLFYAVYDENMRKKVMREHQLVKYMEEALEKKQFLVYLQPKHSTETGAVSGAEALVRWIHPELGFISPGEFIPLFEKNGFIVKLDYYVWREVCRQLHKWHEEGVETVPVSVNASRADFMLTDLPERIDALIEEYEIQPEQLHVEVTESAYTDNPNQIIPMVSALRDMGFKIEMDDFGSGYSSLNMLSELPIDILKLDMRFMESGGEKLKGSKRNILSFIVSLSKWLQLPTVAEAENGQIAYDYIKEHHQEISCILLDLLMPVMDGFQVLEKLHADETLSEIPVIITTETGSNGELRALNLGAHSFVAKPYNPDVLRHHVRKAVEERSFIKLRKEYMRKEKHRENDEKR